ncbi:hypothetical protein [uncultured Methanofollis sp.]|uniref:hypothetical protein n=1 Tax=uncultured Methanofollis sp. TaxID=262500 RepID=UPI0026096B49|nr:hypothetical protein [uncultured Methanofollis sp.]
MRVLKVGKGGAVPCQAGAARILDNCRFCVHSVRFCEGGRWVTSPARAYCMLKRATDGVRLERVSAVECDDGGGEGFRSITTVIS